MWNFPLNPTSYKLYAIANYRNGKGTWNEFFVDMKLLQSVYRLVAANKEKPNYINTVVNTVIRLGNVFHKESLGRLLLAGSPDDLRPEIKTILFFLSRLPKNIPEFDLRMIPINENLAEQLRNL